MSLFSRSLKDAAIVGFALFSLFVGAGNMIFPPYLGLVSGDEWPLGFFVYFMADAGLALVAILALLRSNTIDRFESIMSRLGYWPSRLLMLGVMLSVTAVTAPRTAIVAYDLGTLKDALPGGPVSLVAYSAVYFAVAWLLLVRENKVVDRIGKYLTPALLLGLLAVIVMGLFFPLGPVRPEPQIANVWAMGLMSGYQTMDVAAATMFAYLISRDLHNRGYTANADKFMMVVRSSAVVGVLMAVVYGGLCYLGAMGSTVYGPDVERGPLVVALFQRAIGEEGAAVLGLISVLACLTTAIALISAASAFLESLTGGRLPYKLNVTALAVIFALVANIGLSAMLAVAIPVILILYPAILVMVVLELFDAHIENDNIFKVSVAFALVYGCLDALWDAGAFPALAFLDYLPLQAQGLGWVVPAIVGGLLGSRLKGGRAPLAGES
jgi:LIVCS family branched-chain amino acid:cation transporter